MLDRSVAPSGDIFTIHALSLLSSFAAGTDFHVAPPPLGDDTNPGTLAQPFATIAHAELQTTAGDAVHLHEGV